jgi:F0F1-type ATP synthase membrane subunit b/b'
METIEQEVINDNKKIFAKIQNELLKAEFEILIASAWFTDEELFDVLLGKLQKGVNIEVIIAENQDNEKLDFDLLVSKGAMVYKIPNRGYGMMNQKFCVIDKRIALHGSYNWTVNAKKNNQESMISTNHQETIDALIDNFNNVKNRIMEQNGEPVEANGRAQANKPERPKGIPVELPAKTGSEFEKVLDSMIAAEVGSFNRSLLREQGFERCKANNGDHQVLYHAFDTVYSVFINDIDVIEDKKRRLLTKIEEHRVRTVDYLNKNAELEIDHLETESSLTRKNLETRQMQLEADSEATAKNIDEIESGKIPFLENQNEALDQQIKASEREFIVPRFKWFEFIPISVFNLGLLLYLFIFYSSAAYILLFSVADAKEAEAQGIPVAAAQIFNPDALDKALHKGNTAPLFIFLFVLIPLAFSVLDRFITHKWTSIISTVLGIIFLDMAVAYKVTQAVYEVNYLRGNTNEPWHASLAFSDTNFYLVFVFGAFGLFLFKFAFKKMMHFFEDRDPDIQMQRSQVLIKQLREQASQNTAKIMELNGEIAALEKQIIQLKADLKQIGHEIDEVPVLLNRELQRKRGQLIADRDTIGKIASIYTAHIESDYLPISVDALKDRMNVFLEGWNDCLCEEYSVVRANQKTRQAADVAGTWQNEKLQANRIDKRVKFNAGE